MTAQPSSFPLNQWRLIFTPAAQGAWNMAVDEALLEGMEHPAASPVLRLYSWEPPCLSLGFAQHARDVNLSALQERGWDMVRRPTGGRAILHTDELTYSVIGPLHEPRLMGGVLESYQRLSAALLQALLNLEVPAQAQSATAAPSGSAKGPICFEVPSNYEITLGGKKLIGSAQARRKEGVLQHGSLPLVGDLTRITQVLSFTDEAARQDAARRLLDRAVTIHVGLGRVISWETAAQAFINAFEVTLNLRLVPDHLTAEEKARAEALMVSKYGSREWTFRF